MFRVAAGNSQGCALSQLLIFIFLDTKSIGNQSQNRNFGLPPNGKCMWVQHSEYEPSSPLLERRRSPLSAGGLRDQVHVSSDLIHV